MKRSRLEDNDNNDEAMGHAADAAGDLPLVKPVRLLFSTVPTSLSSGVSLLEEWLDCRTWALAAAAAGGVNSSAAIEDLVLSTPRCGPDVGGSAARQAAQWWGTHVRNARERGALPRLARDCPRCARKADLTDRNQRDWAAGSYDQHAHCPGHFGVLPLMPSLTPYRPILVDVAIRILSASCSSCHKLAVYPWILDAVAAYAIAATIPTEAGDALTAKIDKLLLTATESSMNVTTRSLATGAAALAKKAARANASSGNGASSKTRKRTAGARGAGAASDSDAAASDASSRSSASGSDGEGDGDGEDDVKVSATRGLRGVASLTRDEALPQSLLAAARVLAQMEEGVSAALAKLIVDAIVPSTATTSPAGAGSSAVSTAAARERLTKMITGGIRCGAVVEAVCSAAGTPLPAGDAAAAAAVVRAAEDPTAGPTRKARRGVDGKSAAATAGAGATEEPLTCAARVTSVGVTGRLDGAELPGARPLTTELRNALLRFLVNASFGGKSGSRKRPCPRCSADSGHGRISNVRDMIAINGKPILPKEARTWMEAIYADAGGVLRLLLPGVLGAASFFSDQMLVMPIRFRRAAVRSGADGKAVASYHATTKLYADLIRIADPSAFADTMPAGGMGLNAPSATAVVSQLLARAAAAGLTSLEGSVSGASSARSATHQRRQGHAVDDLLERFGGDAAAVERHVALVRARTVQAIATLIYDSDRVPASTGLGKGVEGVRQRFEKKEGYFRACMMSSRVGNCIRSVISPDTWLDPTEVLVPLRFAIRASVCATLTAHSRSVEAACRWIETGPNSWPGAHRVSVILPASVLLRPTEVPQSTSARGAGAAARMPVDGDAPAAAGAVAAGEDDAVSDIAGGRRARDGASDAASVGGASLIEDRFALPADIVAAGVITDEGPLPSSRTVTWQLARLSRAERAALATAVLCTPLPHPLGGGMSAPVTVWRHLMDGDSIYLNRQPTLHRNGFLGMKARVVSNERTLRFHVTNCKGFNADFDGDEMNVHVVGPTDAAAEASFVALGSMHYTNGTSGEPVRGLLQDHVCAAVMLTQRETLLDRAEAASLVAACVGEHRAGEVSLGMPAVLKPKVRWSGKQVFAAALRVLVGGKRLSLDGFAATQDSYWKALPSAKAAATARAAARVGAVYSAAAASTTGERSIADGPVSGDAAACCANADKSYLSDARVVLRDGKLLVGVIDGRQIGTKSLSLFHVIHEVLGPIASNAAIGGLSRLFATYLARTGVSCGLQDLLIDQPRWAAGIGRLRAAAAETAAKYPGGGKGFAGEESRILGAMNGVLSSVVNELYPSAMVRRFPANSMALMCLTGAKGSRANATQISVALGQQQLPSGRVAVSPFTQRTLPAFLPGDASPLARAFIIGRFLSGVAPEDYFVHAVAGRSGLVDTAVKTAVSGYLQRCIIKGMDNLTVMNDGSVRDGSTGQVVQVRYGSDGLDPRLAAFFGKGGAALLGANASLIAELGTPCVAPAGLLAEKAKAAHADFRGESVATVAAAGAGKRSSSKKGKSSEEPLGGQADVDRWLTTALKGVPKSSADSIIAAAKVAAAAPRAERATVEALVAHRAGAYWASCVSAGEPVGFQAGHALGEPSTQMTLNTFHSATGAASAHIVAGVPRLHQLLRTASVPLKSTFVIVPLVDKTPTTIDRARRILDAHVTQVPFLAVAAAAPTVISVKASVTHPNPTLYVYVPLSVPECRRLRVPAGLVGAAMSNLAKFLYTRIARCMPQMLRGEPIRFLRRPDGPKRVRTLGPTADRWNDVWLDSKTAMDYIMKGFKPPASVGGGNPGSLGVGEDGLESIPEKAVRAHLKKLFADVASSNPTATTIPLLLSISSPSLALASATGEAAIAFKDLIVRRSPISALDTAVQPADFTKTDGPVVGFIRGAAFGQVLSTLASADPHETVFDLTEATSSNVEHIAEFLGVEAAVTSIKDELASVFASHSVTVDPRHLELVADAQTATGTWQGFSRNGVLSHSASPLDRMVFETAFKFVRNAAVDAAVVRRVVWWYVWGYVCGVWCCDGVVLWCAFSLPELSTSFSCSLFSRLLTHSLSQSPPPSVSPTRPLFLHPPYLSFDII